MTSCCLLARDAMGYATQYQCSSLKDPRDLSTFSAIAVFFIGTHSILIARNPVILHTATVQKTNTHTHTHTHRDVVLVQVCQNH